MKANFEGLKALFIGNGNSFAAIYAARDEQDSADAFIADIDLAIKNINQLINSGVSLYDYAATTPSNCVSDFANPTTGNSACHLAGLSKRISDHIKNEFTLILDTSPPSNAAGDGD